MRFGSRWVHVWVYFRLEEVSTKVLAQSAEIIDFELFSGFWSSGVLFVWTIQTLREVSGIKVLRPYVLDCSSCTFYFALSFRFTLLLHDGCGLSWRWFVKHARRVVPWLVMQALLGLINHFLPRWPHSISLRVVLKSLWHVRCFGLCQVIFDLLFLLLMINFMKSSH